MPNTGSTPPKVTLLIPMPAIPFDLPNYPGREINFKIQGGQKVLQCLRGSETTFSSVKFHGDSNGGTPIQIAQLCRAVERLYFCCKVSKG